MRVLRFVFLLAVLLAGTALAPAVALAAVAVQVPTFDGEIPTNLVMWAGIVGFFLPTLIARINAQAWHSDAKAACAFGCCLVAAAGTAFFAGDLIGRDLIASLLIVFTLTIASYKGLWQPIGVTGALERK